jgi:hypothetical protein
MTAGKCTVRIKYWPRSVPKFTPPRVRKSFARTSIFSAISVASIVVFRRFLNRHPIQTDRPLLNQRTAQYVGRVFTLEEPIVNGRGRIRVDDSTWRVEGEDCPAGSKIQVMDAEGVILKVERV